jgi:hypothetical protein
VSNAQLTQAVSQLVEYSKVMAERLIALEIEVAKLKGKPQ